MVKNVVHCKQIFEVLQLHLQKKRAKLSHLRVCVDSWTFTCSSKTVQSSTPSACKMVALVNQSAEKVSTYTYLHFPAFAFLSPSARSPLSIGRQHGVIPYGR